MTAAGVAPDRPEQVAAQVLATVSAVRSVGSYRALRLAAPGIGAAARPGHFAALAVGGPDSPMLLRRCFSLADWDDDSVEVVFAVAGRGTRWLAERRPGAPVDVVAPLGQPFRLPAPAATCVLVGGGYGAAPLVPLARALRAAGCPVRMVLGAAGADRLMAVDAARQVAEVVTVTTEDGTAGRRGRVTDVLPEDLAAAAATGGTVYACGPMAMLAAVARLAAGSGLPSQVAVEEAMACGVGVCMTCVLPVVGGDGRTRMTRACLEGPVFPGDRVRFDAVGTVPSDAVGA